MKSPRKTLFMCLILLVTVLQLPLAIGSPEWLTGWQYRRTHTITGSTEGARTDYQVGIKIYYGSGSDGTEVVDGVTFGKRYLDSKCKTDFGDIRFTNSSGEDLLSYFIEEKNSSDYALFWVKVDAIPISPNSINIYIYYGNPGVSTTSDGNSTFPWLFDDFNDYNINDAPNVVDWDTTGTDGTNTIKIGVDPGNASQKCIVIVEDGGGVGTDLGGLLKGYRTGTAFRFRIRSTDHHWYISWREDGVAIVSIMRDKDDDRMEWYDGGSYQQFNPVETQTAGNWYLIDNQVMDTGKDYFHWVQDGTDGAGGFHSTPDVGWDVFRFTPYRHEAQTIYVGGVGTDDRYIFARNFVDPEPTHTGWGSEEEAPVDEIINSGIIASDSTVYDEQWFFLNASIEVLFNSSIFLFNRIDIDPVGLNMSCSYTNSTDIFVEENDPNNYLELDGSTSVKTDLNNTFVRVDYYLRIHSNVTKEGAYNVTVYSTASGGLNDTDTYTSVFTLTIRTPSAPTLLFGAGFNGTSPYVELHWTHDMLIFTNFAIQNSTDKMSWGHRGSNTTREFTDETVFNGTERYYRVRACRYTGVGWKYSTWSDINFETVYFIPDTGVTPANIPQIDKIEFNTTIAGDRCMVTGAFSDAEGLSGYIFWNNATSPPGGVNSSFTALAGTSDYGYENITLPTSGTRMGVKYYVNDTDNNWAIDTLVIFPSILNETVPCQGYEYNASSIVVITGTLTDGNLASTYAVDGDWYNVLETNTPPGLDIRFNFTGVGENVTCGCVEIYKTYVGHSQHEIQIQAWNFTSTSWKKVGKALFNETADWVCIGLGHSPQFYVSEGGEIWFRFYHPLSGHLAHELQIDRIDLRVVYGAEEGPPCEEAPALVAMGKYYAMAIILLILGLLLGIGMRRRR